MNKQKIVITGALGYLGSKLTELYSGESRYKEIVCIDNRFLSARVQQLISWGMSFHQGSILDREFLQQHLYDADIVYHLAGVTDVAYTSTQSNPVQDELIRSVGIQGTRNVLNAISHRCKVIFPSTHVVFEGLTDTTHNITEMDIPVPVLTYAQGKVVSEVDIDRWYRDMHLLSGEFLHSYVVVRLGSVYGLSGDSMRINIMPNKFSSIAAQDGTINLYGGGVQYKSLVNILDVVRAMKFLAEGDYTGTYHLSNENMTVRQVAEICREINSKVTLVDTTDEIPNLGYTLSNQKLLDTGFRFLYNIRDSIREMITAWSSKPQPEQLEYILRGGKEYTDARGRILNYELPEPINLIGYISSTRETVRANHYHPIQQQKCLLISGRYVSVTQDLSYPNAPIEYKVIHPGDIAVIQPNVAHAMVFLTDSVFLNLVRGEREHENYGITHTIPYTLVAEEMRTQILAMYRSSCRSCGGRDLQLAISLGMSPLANNLIDTPDQHVDMYPLEMEFCPHCYNCQLSVVVPAEKMFDNYLYVSSTSATFRNHFEQAAQRYIEEFNLTPESLVLDIGSNDGVFLRPLQERGIPVVGVEPAVNVAQIANERGIPTINGYFDDAIRDMVYNSYGSPDIITASNVFAHADDLQGIARNVMSLLKPDGVFIIEVQYLMDTIRDMTFDNIYHEHVNYWTVTSLVNFFDTLGYSMFHVEHIDTHGGSIRCYIGHIGKQSDGTVQDMLHREYEQGVNSIGTYTAFAQRVHDIRTTVRRNMQLLKRRFGSSMEAIAGYGSPAKATTALNYYSITSDDIWYTMDDNELKFGKYIPGTEIVITKPPTYYLTSGIRLIIVLAWNFYDSIRAMIPPYISCISIKDLEVPDMPVLDISPTSLTGIRITGKVYDCFIFFNELDLLETRMNIMADGVDYFVIVEANITHSGEPKEFIFEANRERFSRWDSQIIYIKVDDMPTEFGYLNVGAGATIYYSPADYQQECHNRITSALLQSHNVTLQEPLRCREFWQRESIIRALGNCSDDDIIMLSDVDEIANPVTLRQIFDNFDNQRIYCLRQNSYYYKLNLLRESHWVGQRIATYAKVKGYTMGDYRHMRDIIVAKGGWHFSFQGNTEQVRTKLSSYSHSDMATDSVMERLHDRVEQGIDPFDRGRLKRVPVDDTYPQYILDNIEQFKPQIA